MFTTLSSLWFDFTRISCHWSHLYIFASKWCHFKNQKYLGKGQKTSKNLDRVIDQIFLICELFRARICHALCNRPLLLINWIVPLCFHFGSSKLAFLLYENQYYESLCKRMCSFAFVHRILADFELFKPQNRFGPYKN